MDDGDGEMMVMLMTSMMVIVMTVIKPETANDIRVTQKHVRRGLERLGISHT